MKTIHFFSLALLSLLCACSGERDAVDGSHSGELLPLTVAQVSVVGAAACVGESLASRAAVSDDIYQLGVIRAATGSYTAVWNTPYSYASSGWTSTTPIAVDHREASFYAYYPYHDAIDNYAGLSSGYGFTLSAQPYSVSEDICISAAAVKVTNSGSAKPSISFTDMPHVYSRIRLTLTRGAAFESTGAYSITNINFKNGSSKFVVTATQKIDSKVVTPLYTAVSGWDYIPIITLSAGSTAPVIDLLVPPQSLGSGLSMMFTIDGHKRSVTIPASTFAGDALVAGEQYSIALTLRDVAITMSGAVQNGGWNEESKSGNGTGYEDYVPYVELPAIGLRVAKGNLMRAGAGGHWYLAPDQGYYTGAANGGDYFCWGIADPTSIGNGTGTSTADFSAGCVAVLGSGWRVPSKADNEKLAGGAHVWGSYTSQRGESSGRYFGTSSVPAPANRDNYAFLPAAGLRYAGGSMSYVGNGFYWSSERYGDSDSDSACNLSFDSSSVNWTYFIGFLYYGQSVRCVADSK